MWFKLTLAKEIASQPIIFGMDAIIKDCNYRQETEIKAKDHTFTQGKGETK